ncbi:MAG: permease, partial [Dehalococcoidia bacterium]|nr:permease [Dehalococcoidia bacterium]
MLVQFFIVFKDYLIEVLPFLVIGFLLSGLVHQFVPSGWVERHLGGRGIKPLLYSTLAGTVLPICCLGSLPVAVSFHQKGARLGAVLAFLVATPATSITALLVSYALLGLKFTV